MCKMNVLGTYWTACRAPSDGPCYCDVVVKANPPALIEPCPCGAPADPSGLCAPCYDEHAPKLYRQAVPLDPPSEPDPTSPPWPNVETLLLDAHHDARACLGVGCRTCDSPATDGSYCAACQARLEAIHATAAGKRTPQSSGAISEYTTPNGMIQIKAGGMTVCCVSAELYEALRLYFANDFIESRDYALAALRERAA